MSSWYRWEDDVLILDLHVQPRASRDEILEPYGDRLKVRITAPPVEGRANEYLIGFLAKIFGVPKKQVRVISGQRGHDKRLRIVGPRRLLPAITAPDALK